MARQSELPPLPCHLAAPRFAASNFARGTGMNNKRSIFEEVGTAKSVQPAPRQTGAIDSAARNRSRRSRSAIRWWVMLLFTMVVLMTALGGLTRLTDSGLSITEWHPVTGALPPMNATDWQAEFDRYKAIPEYQLQNRGMTLAEFKAIYWWEWSHRQLGRTIGLIWAIGFVAFAVTRRIPPGWSARLLFVGALGGAQGAIGWWMVASGLTGSQLDVAPYRLATHLGLAFGILGVIVWYAMLLGRPERELMQARRAREPGLMTLSRVLIALAFLQILIGALVAGLDAGRNYIDWPLMAGGFLPPDALQITPVWRNFFENDGLVQFIHRMVGYTLFLWGLFVWSRSRNSAHGRTRRAFDWIAVALIGQLVLGIITVMHSAAPHYAIIHQLGAVLLWALILRGRFLAQYPITQTIRGT